METKKKYRQYFDLVKSLLIEDARYRDSDQLLLNRIHNDEIKKQGYDPKTLSVYTYWKWLVAGNLSDESTIERCRRKVQQSHPELRGEKYHKKYGHQLEVILAVQDL